MVCWPAVRKHEKDKRSYNMATAVGKGAAIRDAPNGGFYKCEECSKSFNRMASYEAHIRMHAQSEVDALDLVFSYSGKIHNPEGSSAERREMRSRARGGRRGSRFETSPRGRPESERPRVAGESRLQPLGGTAAAGSETAVDVLADNAQSSAVSSTGDALDSGSSKSAMHPEPLAQGRFFVGVYV